MVETGTEHYNANASRFVVRQMRELKPESCLQRSVEAKVIIQIDYLRCLNCAKEWRSDSGQVQQRWNRADVPSRMF